MKKIIYILCVSLFLGTINYAQEIYAPKIAIELVNTNYHGLDPEIIDAHWTKVDGKFHFNYTYTSKKRTVIFNDKGNFLQSWIEIPTEKLRTEVAKYLTNQYPKAAIIQCYELTSNTAPERNVVDLENEAGKFRLRFRPDGSFYSTEKLD